MIVELPISLVISAKNPVRQNRDEEKLKQLIQSIDKKGVLQSIKVRPISDSIKPCGKHWFHAIDHDYPDLDELFDCISCNDLIDLITDYELDEDGCYIPSFEIVYGSRRFEACLQLKLETIPVVIGKLTDSETLVEALIENIQREDMLDIEIAEAIENIVYISTGLKSATYVNTVSGERIYPNELIDEIKKVAEFLGIAYQQTSRYLAMLKPLRKPIVDTFYEENPSIKDVKTKADWLQQAMPDEDIETQKAVARKAVREELGQKKVRQVAQSIAAAPTKEAKEKLLEWEFNSEIHNPERIKERVEQFGEHDPLYLDEKPSPQDSWEKVPEIKIMVDGLVETIKVFTKLLKTINKASKIKGRLSFEAKQFTATKLRKFRDEINTLLNELEMN